MAGGDEQQKEVPVTQDDKKDAMSKKQKDAKTFASMAWADQSASDALQKLTEQLKNSGAADQLNFGDEKHQQIQNLQQINQLNQQLRQIDPLGNLSQQLQ